MNKESEVIIKQKEERSPQRSRSREKDRKKAECKCYYYNKLLTPQNLGRISNNKFQVKKEKIQEVTVLVVVAVVIRIEEVEVIQEKEINGHIEVK